MDDNLKKWLPWIAVAAVALIVVAIIAIRSGDSDDAAATTTTAQGTTTEPASTTSVATTTVPTTTVPPSTTLPPTTTVAPPTTLPPTTLPPTTTIPEPAIGELILEVDGVEALETHVNFGMGDEDAIAAVTASLGGFDDDTGWVPFDTIGVCPIEGDFRGVGWGSFMMLFTKGDTEFGSGGAPHFFSYYYNDGEPAQPFATDEMIELGSTVAELKAAYGGPDFFFGEFAFDESLGFWKYDQSPDDETGLSGVTSGLADTDTVRSIDGGIGCGE